MHSIASCRSTETRDRAFLEAFPPFHRTNSVTLPLTGRKGRYIFFLHLQIIRNYEARWMPSEGLTEGQGDGAGTSYFGRRARSILGGLAGLLALALGVLGTTDAQAAKDRDGRPLRVVTTFTVIQDIAQNVAGDAAIVESITKPGAEIHDYQPTPLDVVKAQSADLVLWNGLNLERWFSRFFQNVKDVPSVVISEGIEPIAIREG